jgi:hypothetical protein
MPDDNVTIDAEMSIDEYLLIRFADGVKLGAEYRKVGEKLPTNFKAPEKTGYTHTGWDPAIPATMPANRLELNAVYTPNVYQVDLNTDGGTINSGNITQYTYGVGATLPTDVTRDGFTFTGWYDIKNTKSRSKL